MRATYVCLMEKDGNLNLKIIYCFVHADARTLPSDQFPKVNWIEDKSHTSVAWSMADVVFLIFFYFGIFGGLEFGGVRIH